MLSEKTNALTFYREFISKFSIFSFRFRFFGATGDNANNRNMAGYFGPLFRNFRFYGGRPGEELTRGGVGHISMRRGAAHCARRIWAGSIALGRGTPCWYAAGGCYARQSLGTWICVFL